MSVSSIKQIISKREALERLQSELQALEQSDEFKREKAFLDEVEQLLIKHKRTKEELVALFLPESGRKPRRQRRESAQKSIRHKKTMEVRTFKRRTAAIKELLDSGAWVEIE